MSPNNTQSELRVCHLGEFKFIFKANLGYESQDKEGTFDEKPEVKNLMHVYFQV
jgi:hypothetical protein